MARVRKVKNGFMSFFAGEKMANKLSLPRRQASAPMSAG
jgi:hypothetical protein